MGLVAMNVKGITQISLFRERVSIDKVFFHPL